MILDPPAFGRGPKGKGGSNTWKLDKDLPELVEFAGCAGCENQFPTITCHDPKWPGRKLQTLLQHSHGMPKRYLRRDRRWCSGARRGVDLLWGTACV